MGNIIYNKGLLLDEADFEGEPCATLEGLAERIVAHLEEDYGGFDPDSLPSLDIFGVASERFGATEILALFPDKAVWLETGGTFESALRREFRARRIPEAEAFLEGRLSLGELDSAIRAQAGACLSAQEDVRAGELIRSVAHLKASGLPCLKCGPCVDCTGDEELIDCRSSNRGPGRRVLAEIGFNWGQ